MPHLGLGAERCRGLCFLCVWSLKRNAFTKAIRGSLLETTPNVSLRDRYSVQNHGNMALGCRFLMFHPVLKRVLMIHINRAPERFTPLIALETFTFKFESHFYPYLVRSFQPLYNCLASLSLSFLIWKMRWLPHGFILKTRNITALKDCAQYLLHNT